jgi:ATP-dependent protease ClpP protease subunit
MIIKANEKDTERFQLHLDYLFEKGVNFKERTILINSDINDDVFSLVEAALSEMESYNRSAITIRISSDGGDVFAALAIVGRIKRTKCKIITEGYGRIMSAATLILACGDERLISRYACFMHHEASYELEGRHSYIKAEMNNLDKMEELWAQWMADFSKKSKKFYLEEAKHTDKYWDPEQLLEYGIVDKVI